MGLPAVPSIHDLEAEFERLMMDLAALTTEHRKLKDRAVNIEEHEQHRAKLKAHIAAVRAHIERLRDRSH